MKKILLVALAAITLASCAKNEVVELNEGNAISFRAWTENASRKAPTTTASIADFDVWAYLSDETLYMDAFKVSGGTGAWDYDNHKFWPEGTVDFFAFSPAAVADGVVADAEKDELVIAGFTQTNVLGDQIDLLYAATLGQTRAANATGVNMVFDHALSLISFKALNSNTAGMKVTISGVSIDNVSDTATFTHPLTATAENDDVTAGVDRAKWSAWDAKDATYAAGMENADYLVTDASVEITEDAAGRLLLIPQEGTAWTPGAVDEGARFIVTCKIQDTDTGVYLLGDSSNYGEVAIPFTPNWHPGKHYIYTFQFGEGAGYDPLTGTPIVAPINFNEIVVDDFAAGANAGVDAL
ncbi:MAG: fimbrillin family protein [Alistipes sp.]|nr:fimbrillin family protein [Alistipes sp.]